MQHYNGNNRYTPSIVCIGGGTGLSTMLRGLKLYTAKITAIVTVADDGGGSGVLREELGMLPPGDIRNCILALSNIEPTMEKLFNYRFTSGSLTGQSFGNLFLAAMNGISSSFEEAVARMCDVLAITGRVLPVTNENIHLMAEFEDGETILGESKIFAGKNFPNSRIKKVKLVPDKPSALPESLEAIEEADLIVLGPGSLYTSIIPNLLVSGISEAIAASNSLKLYICNIMTQNGETENYTVSDHIKALFMHAGTKLFDICLANNLPAPPELLEKYGTEGAEQLFADREEIEKCGVKLYEAPISGRDKNLVRHNSRLLAREIMRIFREESPTRPYNI